MYLYYMTSDFIFLPQFTKNIKNVKFMMNLLGLWEVFLQRKYVEVQVI